MANPQLKRQAQPHSRSNATQSEANVSGCVSNLIQAFTNSLDVFKRLRERRRKRKHSKQQSAAEKARQYSGDELQLSNSLRRGPQDIQDVYEKCYGRAGERFAKGDAVAHSSLAETLLKLNTGLVGIIAAFLHHDTKSKHPIDLDYKSLTNLSNTSRAEAVDSLNQLYRRLSHSQLQVYQIGQCQRCGRPTSSAKQHSCPSSNSVASKSHSDKRSGGTRPRQNAPTVTRMPLKSKSQPQLVVVRPRNHRKTSSSGNSSATASTSTRAKSPSHSAPTTAITSPLHSPLPSPPPPLPHHHYTPKSPDPYADIPIPVRRRAEKDVFSTYTFASDSTKLGEIPMRNWVVPFDYEQAERLNKEAYASGYPHAGLGPENGVKKQKKGLFGFLRRSGGD